MKATPTRWVISLMATAAIALAIAPAGAAEPAPAAVVESFNAAITAGDAAAAQAHLAEGGVQFTLRSMHDGVGPDKLTAPLVQHWSMILPVIFASTQRYSRNVEVLNAETHGDLATVWTRTRSSSLRQGKTQPADSDFTEVYLLAATVDGWKIASIADNRAATSISD